MKKINYFFTLLLFCTLVACSSDNTPKVDEAAEKAAAAEKCFKRW